MKQLYRNANNISGLKTECYHLTNREAFTVLCSVIKHVGSGYSTKEVKQNSAAVTDVT